MLSLDEAIAHAKEKAEMYRFRIKNRLMTMLEIGECEREIEEHEQLAVWLEELKARREADRTSDSKPFDVLLAQRYSKAIDDFSRWLVKYKIVDEDSMPEIIMDFNEEKLKEGGENEK